VKCLRSKFLTVSGLLLVSGVALADSFTTVDSFIGSGSSGTYAGADVVGDPAKFDLSSVVVTRTDTGITFDIYGNYFSNVGELGTALGALFLNVDGGGTGVQGSDGATWNYGIKLGGFVGGSSSSAAVYRLDSTTDLVTSNEMNPGTWGAFREGQEVDFFSDALIKESLLSAHWTLTPVPGAEGKLSFFIPTSIFGGSEVFNSAFDFSFAMSCANDVIRGSGQFSEVPEPGTLTLLGLAGIAAARRRRSQSLR